MNLNENIDRIKNLMGIYKSYDEDIINEALSDIVYHHTNLEPLKNILLTDKFYGSFAHFGGLESKISKKRYFYISTTRNRNQVSIEFKDRPVRIKLDGRKLSQQYKGAPVDYYGYRDKKLTKAPKSYYDPEFEDRIILDKPYIENASKYILGISIYQEYKDYIDINENLIVINELCKQKKIPLAIYDNLKDFRNDKNPINTNESFFEKLKNDIKISNEYLKNLITKEDEFEYSKLEYKIIALIALKNEISPKEMFPKLTEDDIVQIDEIIYDIKNSDSINYYDFEISITKLADKKNYESKDILNKLLKDMRKYGTRDMEKYIKAKTKDEDLSWKNIKINFGDDVR